METEKNEKELNQTIIKPNSDNEIADFRKKQEARYNEKLEKINIQHAQEISEMKNNLIFETETKPAIKQEYLKAGGIETNFNDFYAIKKNEIEPKDIAGSIAKQIETTKWAFNTEKLSVNSQLNQGLGHNSKIDLSKFVPGTIYKKR